MRHKLLKIFVVFASLFLFLVSLFFDLSNSLQKDTELVLVIGIIMVLFWAFEILPMAVTSLLPLILFPLLKIADIKQVSVSYADPVIFLFMGGFLIAMAMEKYGLHKRIALNIVNQIGTSAKSVLLGFIIATTLISMWISNTATAMMMFPMAMSIVSIFEKQYGTKKTKNFSALLLLSIAISANIGGVGTIIGTPPNVVAAGYLRNNLGIDISFLDWMLYGVPFVILFTIIVYFMMVFLLRKDHLPETNYSKNYIKEELLNLGKISSIEKKILLVFSITALLWISRELIIKIPFMAKLDDTIIALIGAVLLFIIFDKNNGNKTILEWKDTTSLPWGILIMFGGGLALAKQLDQHGLLKILANNIAGSFDMNIILLIVLLSALAVMLSEIMSNVALTMIITPIVASIAIENNIDPVMMVVPLAFASSCAFMMPMGTPPNAIVFASEKIKISKMMKIGFLLNMITIVLISLFVKIWFSI